MIKLLTTWACTAAALAVAAWIFTGIRIGGAETSDQLITLAIVSAILALINNFVGPVIKLLSLPFIILTLGLMLIVINALLLMLTGWVADQVDVRFVVDGFWTAVGGSIVISLVNAALQSLLGD